MRKLLVGIWVAATGIALPACERKRSECGARAQVVGGVRVFDAQADEHGKRTSALALDEGLCTAVVVSNRVALTAFHCVRHGEARELLFGTDSSVPQFRRRVQRSVGHPTEDIAVVSYEGGLPPGFLATPLAEPELVLNSGELITITGYGRVSPLSSVGSGILSKTTLPYAFSRVDPSKWHLATLPFLWLDATQGSGACNGDSGGPGFVERDGVWYVVGVTQGGEARCGNEYNRYTDVRLVHAWLQSHLTLKGAAGREPTTPEPSVFDTSPPFPSESGKADSADGAVAAVPTAAPQNAKTSYGDCE